MPNYLLLLASTFVAFSRRIVDMNMLQATFISMALTGGDNSILAKLTQEKPYTTQLKTLTL